MATQTVPRVPLRRDSERFRRSELGNGPAHARAAGSNCGPASRYAKRHRARGRRTNGATLARPASKRHRACAGGGLTRAPACILSRTAPRVRGRRNHILAAMGVPEQRHRACAGGGLRMNAKWRRARACASSGVLTVCRAQGRSAAVSH